MSRWIDADALIEIMDERKRPEVGADASKERYRYIQWLADYQAINDAPSIDLVRCKECRWWLKNLTEDDEDEAYLHCPIEDGKPDDFCSYGERRE